jgi:hypothetical protein
MTGGQFRRLRQRAAKLDLALVNRETGELAEGAVSPAPARVSLP